MHPFSLFPVLSHVHTHSGRTELRKEPSLEGEAPLQGQIILRNLKISQKSRSLPRGPGDEFREGGTPPTQGCQQPMWLASWASSGDPNSPHVLAVTPRCGHSEPFQLDSCPRQREKLTSHRAKLEAGSSFSALVSPARYSSQGTGSECTAPSCLKALKWPGASSLPLDA